MFLRVDVWLERIQLWFLKLNHIFFPWKIVIMQQIYCLKVVCLHHRIIYGGSLKRTSVNFFFWEVFSSGRIIICAKSCWWYLCIMLDHFFKVFVIFNHDDIYNTVKILQTVGFFTYKLFNVLTRTIQTSTTTSGQSWLEGNDHQTVIPWPLK